MASRVAISVKRLQSTMAAPIITSEPTTLPRRRKAIAPSRSGFPTPSRRPSYFFLSSELPELPSFVEPPYNPVLISPELTFSFEQAKKHLIEADGRFEMMFAELKCRPFEQLEPIDPFQTLINSIVYQQGSWLGAKYQRNSRLGIKLIRHHFLRLFDRSLPKGPPRKHGREINYTFPSPGRLASVDESILSAAGLYGKKAEYVLDIANRFADGRLSTQKLEDASDKELMRMLTDIRGVGKLAASIFAIFSLRRPDILPVDDLKAQKGLLNWVISSHEPDKYPLRMNPQKPEEYMAIESEEDASVLAAPGEASTSTAKASSSSKQPSDVLLVPKAPVQLPEGMTLEILKARPDSKKGKRRYYLLPSEMEALTTSWKPYRSLGAFYLRALAGGPK